jgi:chromosome segregation ATPase
MKYLWCIAALLATTVLTIDHYVVGKYVKDLSSTQVYATTVDDALGLVYGGQIVLIRQSEQIETMDKQLVMAAKMVRGLKEELARTIKQLEAASESLQELTDENSDLYTENDRISREFHRLSNELDRLRTVVNELEQKLKDVSNETTSEG